MQAIYDAQGLCSAQKLLNDHEILLSAEIKSPLQHITCYVMCDEIGNDHIYKTLC